MIRVFQFPNAPSWVVRRQAPDGRPWADSGGLAGHIYGSAVSRSRAYTTARALSHSSWRHAARARRMWYL